MTIHFLFGRRESLHGKAEAYKKSVRQYLESSGYSQTTDSSVEGSFEDMIFVNPNVDPGKKFLIEAKAETLSVKSKKLARELVQYFRKSKVISSQNIVRFKLFIQGVKKPKEWESIFSEIGNLKAVQNWCEWYNDKCLEREEEKLDEETIKQVSEFFANSEVVVGNVIDLQQAAIDIQSISGLSIPKMARNLFALVERRRAPISAKSKLVMNILPIEVPADYFMCKSTAMTKEEIYSSLKGKVIPPFLFTRNREILTFAEFDKDNPLKDYAQGDITKLGTKNFQMQNPTFSSQLVNIHLRRIFWNRGIYRDPDADIFYFPMLDKSRDAREILDQRGVERWVVKKIIHLKDTMYHKKGEINFFFHRGLELGTPTYWGISFAEMIPRRYYTLDGEKWIDGETRAKIDRKFKNPLFDRSQARLGQMKFWKFLLFESDFVIPPEKWFSKFQFGSFIAETVGWSPQVIGRNQRRLWDFKEGA